MADEEVIPLDPDLIKVLASDTRRDILRHLQERPMTVTELSRVLDLRKATVSEHLKKLTDSGLVSRRDDERLWVYYELSRAGKRIVSPGRTRFYLVVGATVVAAIAAVVMASLFFYTGAGPADDMAATGGLNVELQEGTAYAGGPASFQAFVAGPDGQPVEVSAYLLTAEEAEQLARGDGATLGTPLEVGPSGTSALYRSDEGASAESTMTSDGEGTSDGAKTDVDAGDTRETSALAAFGPSPFVSLHSPTPLEPGTYFVYVRDANGNDNRFAMPALTVAPAQVLLEPSTWWRGLDGEVHVQALDATGQLDATVQLVPVADDAPAAPALTLRMAGSVARANASQLDALAPGGYEVHLLPDGQRTWQRTGSVLAVREPQFALAPTVIPAGSTREVALTVLAGERPLGDIPVLLDGAPVNTTVAGAARLALLVPTQAPHAATVQVGRLATLTLDVRTMLVPTLTTLEDGSLRLDVTGANATPRPNVQVFLDDTLVGTTSESGQLELTRPARGVHTLGLAAPTAHRIERTIMVDGWNVTEVSPSLTVQATSLPARDGSAQLEAALRNDGPSDAEVTLVVRDGPTIVASQTVQLPAGANATRTLVMHLNRAGPIALEAEVWDAQDTPLTWTNATSPTTPPPAAAPPGDGASQGTDAATTVAAQGALATSGPVEVNVEDLRVEVPPVQAGPAEKALLDGRLVADEGIAAETPLPGALALLVVFAAAGFAAARRRRG